jgi:predicted Zn-dependent protease
MLRGGDLRGLRKIAAGIFRFAGKSDTEVTVREYSGYLTRFARNAVQQNADRRTVSISIRMIEEGKSARLEISDYETAALNDAVRILRDLIRARRERGSELPLPGKQKYREVRDFDPLISKEGPLTGRDRLAALFRRVRGRTIEASGYQSAALRSVLIANTRGLEAFHRSSAWRMGVTLRHGKGIGYSSVFSPFAAGLDPETILEEALRRLEISSRTVGIRPGRYPVILAPRAASEFLGPVFEEMNGRKVADRDSFFWGKKGRRIFSPEISIDDDVYHPRQAGLPFDGTGLPRRKITLVEKGVVSNFVYDRKAARDLGARPTGHAAGAIQPATMPLNVVIRPGKASWKTWLDGLPSAIFIPHIWYHQITNPDNFLATGLIKGCALLWRNGRWAGGSSCVRYLESVPEALSRAAAVSAEAETIKDREYGASRYPFLLLDGFRIV